MARQRFESSPLTESSTAKRWLALTHASILTFWICRSSRDLNGRIHPVGGSPTYRGEALIFSAVLAFGFHHLETQVSGHSPLLCRRWSSGLVSRSGGLERPAVAHRTRSGAYERLPRRRRARSVQRLENLSRNLVLGEGNPTVGNRYVVPIDVAMSEEKPWFLLTVGSTVLDSEFYECRLVETLPFVQRGRGVAAAAVCKVVGHFDLMALLGRVSSLSAPSPLEAPSVPLGSGWTHKRHDERGALHSVSWSTQEASESVILVRNDDRQTRLLLQWFYIAGGPNWIALGDVVIEDGLASLLCAP